MEGGSAASDKGSPFATGHSWPLQGEGHFHRAQLDDHMSWLLHFSNSDSTRYSPNGVWLAGRPSWWNTTSERARSLHFRNRVGVKYSDLVIIRPTHPRSPLWSHASDSSRRCAGMRASWAPRTLLVTPASANSQTDMGVLPIHSSWWDRLCMSKESNERGANLGSSCVFCGPARPSWSLPASPGLGPSCAVYPSYIFYIHTIITRTREQEACPVTAVHVTDCPFQPSLSTESVEHLGRGTIGAQRRALNSKKVHP